MIGRDSREFGLFKGAILLLIGVVMTATGLARHLLVTTSLGVITLIAAAGFFYFAFKESRPPRRPDSN
jgi:uncharacterized membrane protein HdeD (DUF308 family)